MLAAQQHVPTCDEQGRLVQVSPFMTANGQPILHLGIIGQETPAAAAAAAAAVAAAGTAAARPPVANPYQRGRAETDPVARMLDFTAAPPAGAPPVDAAAPPAGAPAAGVAAPPADAEMQEAAAAPPGPAYTGGISTILSGTNNFISEVVVPTIETFTTTVRNNTVAARIKKATTPAELDQNA